MSSNEALLPRSSKALLLDSSGAGASPPLAVPNLRSSETAAAVPSCSVLPLRAAHASRSCPDKARALGAVHASLARRMPTTLPRMGGSCVNEAVARLLSDGHVDGVEATRSHEDAIVR